MDCIYQSCLSVKTKTKSQCFPSRIKNKYLKKSIFYNLTLIKKSRKIKLCFVSDETKKYKPFFLFKKNNNSMLRRRRSPPKYFNFSNTLKLQIRAILVVSVFIFS